MATWMEHAVLMGSMFLFQMGGRSAPLELTPGQKAFFSTPVARHLLIFSSIFVMIRSLYGALFLYAMFIMLMLPRYGLLSEHSPLSVLPRWARMEGFEAERKLKANQRRPEEPAPWSLKRGD